MPNLKLPHTLALGEDKLPDKGHSDQVSWANAGKIKHPDEMHISTQPRIPQHLRDWDSNLSLAENFLVNQDLNNTPPQYQNGDCFSFTIWSSSDNSLNNFVGQGTANCLPLYGWADQGSARGLWGEDMLTSQNYVDYPPNLFNESIAGEVHAYSTEIPGSSIAYIAIAPDVQMMVPNAALHSMMPTPFFETLQSSFPLAVAEMADNISSSAGINLTILATQRQQICQGEQISELWRERNHIKEAVNSVSKLGDQLQGWNKHQIDIVQEASSASCGKRVQSEKA